MGRVAVIGRSLSSDAPRTWAMLRFPEMKGLCLTCHDVLYCIQRHSPSFWHVAACKASTPPNGGARLFPSVGTRHYYIDSFQCNGRSNSRAIAFFRNSIFCRYQHAIHVFIKPAQSLPSTEGPPKFPWCLRHRCWVGG